MDPMDLLRKLAAARNESHENYNLKTVDKMNDREIIEFREIGVVGRQLNDEFNKLMNRKQDLEARQTLFWSGLRRCRPAIATVEFLHLEENADGSIDIQTGTKKEKNSNPFGDD